MGASARRGGVCAFARVVAVLRGGVWRRVAVVCGLCDRIGALGGPFLAEQLDSRAERKITTNVWYINSLVG